MATRATTTSSLDILHANRYPRCQGRNTNYRFEPHRTQFLRNLNTDLSGVRNRTLSAERLGILGGLLERPADIGATRRELVLDLRGREASLPSAPPSSDQLTLAAMAAESACAAAIPRRTISSASIARASLSLESVLGEASAFVLRAFLGGDGVCGEGEREGATSHLTVPGSMVRVGYRGRRGYGLGVM